jgi:hypothetical protein
MTDIGKAAIDPTERHTATPGLPQSATAHGWALKLLNIHIGTRLLDRSGFLLALLG